MAFTENWRPSSPADADLISSGAQEIRKFKTAIGERFAIDHYGGTTTALMDHADTGKHKQITLIETADIGTGATGYPILGAQTTGGAPELVYTDEGDNDVVITSAGKLRSGLLDIASIAAGDQFYYDGSAMVRFAKGTTNQVQTQGGSNAPVWSNLVDLLPAGSIVQFVSTQDGALATGTTAMPYDDTIPQNTEGDQYMTRSITPSNASNKLIIFVVCHVTTQSGGGSQYGAGLFQDSTAPALASSFRQDSNAQNAGALVFFHVMTAGTVSATTFKVRAGANSGTVNFNGEAGARKHGGVLSSGIYIMEVKV